MDSREEFEDLVCKVTNARNFTIREEDGEYASERVQDMFLIWKAVCAQSVQSAKPVAWMNPSNPHEVISYKKKNEIQRCYNLGIGKSAERYSAPLYTQQGSVPEGWKLVPVEPTREMRRAFHEAHELFEDGEEIDGSPDDEWRAMLDAAPTAPQPEGDGWVRCEEPFGTESAYREAKDRPMGSNMNISCALFSELVDAFRRLKRPQPPKQEGE